MAGLAVHVAQQDRVGEAPRGGDQGFQAGFGLGFSLPYAKGLARLKLWSGHVADQKSLFLNFQIGTGGSQPSPNPSFGRGAGRAAVLGFSQRSGAEAQGVKASDEAPAPGVLAVPSHLALALAVGQEGFSVPGPNHLALG